MLEPLGDRILIEVVEDPLMSAGGVLIPDAAREKPQRGIVKGVGPGKRDERGELVPVGVEVGDEVLFSKYGGTQVTLPTGEEVLILRESDLLGRWLPDPESSASHEVPPAPGQPRDLDTDLRG